MMDIIPEISQLGIIGFILYFCIREFFQWLGKSKTNGKDVEIALLKTEICSLKEKLSKIENNDLFHIKIQLEQNATEHRELRDILLRIEKK